MELEVTIRFKDGEERTFIARWFETTNEYCYFYNKSAQVTTDNFYYSKIECLSIRPYEA